MDEVTYPDKYTLKYERRQMPFNSPGGHKLDRQLSFNNYHHDSKIYVSVYKDNEWIISFDQKICDHSIEMFKTLQISADIPIEKRLFRDCKQFFIEDKNKGKLGLDEYTYLNINDHIHLIETIGLHLVSWKIEGSLEIKYKSFDVFMTIIQKYSKSFSNEQIKYTKEFLLK